MKQVLIKAGVFLLTFIGALLFLSNYMNRGNNDMTMDISEASLPVVYIMMNNERCNTLHGYSVPMDCAFERETITVLDEHRGLGIEIDDYGRDIMSLSYEVRDPSGQRLIEKTEITDFNTTDTGIMANATIKDLIKADTEYSLIFVIDTGSETVRYYTRMVWPENYHVEEKINFVEDFSNKTFSKDEAQSIRKYLESNSLGDNTSFSHVNIHSSFSQVTWGDMPVRKISEPVPEITQIQEQTASIALRYYVATGENDTLRTFYVEEFYRVRRTDTRMYLLDFDRTMQEVLDENNPKMDNQSMKLGIVDPNFEFYETEDGNMIIFENFGRLFGYSLSDNKLSVIFSFFEFDNPDTRNIYNQHGIKILSADEVGNVNFLVYGYMNRGRHEGEVGIQIYSYDGALNTLEEKVYIPYDKSSEMLMNEMKTLHYVNKENTFFVILGRTTYAININNRNYDIMMDQTVDNTLYVSKSGEMIVWQTSESPYDCEELLLMDLETGTTAAIDSKTGDYIYPLGFIGEDLIYGVARKDDIIKDGSGNIVFPMYEVYIRSAFGAILKTYSQDDVYVTGCEINENQVTLYRVKKKNESEYIEVSVDQIMNSEEVETGKNKVVTTNDETYKRNVSISFKNTIGKKAIQVRTPKEVLFEGGREMNLRMVDRDDTFYYVYGARGLEGIYSNPANAVIDAYERSGVVINDSGDYVYIKGSRSARNQIMAITAVELQERETSMSVCLDTVLALEGIVKNTRNELAIGKSPYKILKESLTDVDVLDLTGTTLDAVLYYVNKDIPVLAALDDGEAVLITGFNEVAVVIFNPAKGTLSKMGMKEATEWFTKNGNTFITYTKATQN